MIRRSLTLLQLAGALILCLLSASPPAGSASHVSYRVRQVEGVSAHVITANLNEPAVKVGIEIAPEMPEGDEDFAAMLRRAKPVAAINGAFFDKTTLRPIGDLVINGKIRHSGRMGTVLAVTPDNKATIRRVEWGRSQDWSRYRTVLGCGPTLLLAGQVDVRPGDERFRDPHILGASNRSAAGVTAGGKLILASVRSPVTLGHLALIMRELGCVDAMNLDGGASMAMYYRGRVILPAGRRLTNILTIHEG